MRSNYALYMLFATNILHCKKFFNYTNKVINLLIIKYYHNINIYTKPVE